jgi:hypothetical protein
VNHPAFIRLDSCRWQGATEATRRRPEVVDYLFHGLFALVRIVHAQSDEPAKEQIVVELLH